MPDVGCNPNVTPCDPILGTMISHAIPIYPCGPQGILPLEQLLCSFWCLDYGCRVYADQSPLVPQGLNSTLNAPNPRASAVNYTLWGSMVTTGIMNLVVNGYNGIIINLFAGFYILPTASLQAVTGFLATFGPNQGAPVYRNLARLARH